MFVIIGIGVVLVSVLGGFLLEGGNFLVLMQWSEFIIILGSATGALVVATPKTTLVKMVQYVLGSFKSTVPPKKAFRSYYSSCTRLSRPPGSRACSPWSSTRKNPRRASCSPSIRLS